MLAWCRYTTQGDYPHRSSTGFAASAHGWWKDRSPGSCPEYADVEVTLQAHLCFGNPHGRKHCWWDTLDHQEQRIRAEGGSGRRTTAPRVRWSRIGPLSMSTSLGSGMAPTRYTDTEMSFATPHGSYRFFLRLSVLKQGG